MASLKVTGVALLICLGCGANAFRINAYGRAPASHLSMRLDAERAPSRRPVWPALQRTVAPLLLSLLPALAPAIQGAYAEEGSAVVATTTDSGDSTGRLMGRVQPIDSLSGESEGLFKRARIAESDGDFGKALRLYDRLTRVAPGYPYAWSNKGNAHVALGELEQGLDSYRRALEADTWVVYLNKATTELALEDVDACIRDLDQARTLRGQPDVLLFANKGLALERKGAYAEALDNYENAALANPKEVQPWWLRYALVLYEENQDIKAMEVMRKVNAKFSREPEVKAALSTLIYAFGDKEEAGSIWGSLKDEQFKYRDRTFLTQKLHWPPRAVKTLEGFVGLYTPTNAEGVRKEPLY